MRIIATDTAKVGGDYSTEVEVEVGPDGSMTILDVRQYRSTLDLKAVVTDQPKLQAKPSCQGRANG